MYRSRGAPPGRVQLEAPTYIRTVRIEASTVNNGGPGLLIIEYYVALADPHLLVESDAKVELLARSVIADTRT